VSRLTVITREGARREIDGESGLSIMELIRENGMDEMLALCGGNRRCATCHIYVDPAYRDGLPAMSDDENMLLDLADERRDTSRLACQIFFEDALTGIQVTIAPED